MKKLSYYNFIYPINSKGNEYIIYNSHSNCLAVLSSHEYQMIQSLLNDSSFILPLDFSTEMHEGGYLIDDEIDELACIRHEMNCSKYSSKRMGLTIAPTMNCNFDCVYCYEKEKRSNVVMSDAVIDAISNYIDKNGNSIESLYISWYGGEPLMAFDIIRTLSENVISISKNKKFHYDAGIITNGYLLTEDYAKELSSLGISNCQITIDGIGIKHDIKRPLINGQGTFDKIMKNVDKAANYINNISIRVNLDGDNKDSIRDVEQFFSSLNKSNLHVYPAPIKNKEGCFDAGECLNNEEFLLIEQTFLEEKGDRAVCSKYPFSKGNVCCADNINSFVIAPDGGLYKCWSDMGNENMCFGSILEPQKNMWKEITYLRYDPTEDPKCKSCKLLPICMGGCPYDRYNNNERCSTTEYVTKEYITKIAKILNHLVDNK